MTDEQYAAVMKAIDELRKEVLSRAAEHMAAIQRLATQLSKSAKEPK